MKLERRLSNMESSIKSRNLLKLNKRRLLWGKCPHNIRLGRIQPRLLRSFVSWDFSHELWMTESWDKIQEKNAILGMWGESRHEMVSFETLIALRHTTDNLSWLNLVFLKNISFLNTLLSDVLNSEKKIMKTRKKLTSEDKTKRFFVSLNWINHFFSIQTDNVLFFILWSVKR